MLLPFSLALSHACSKLSELCLSFQQRWHTIPVLKDGIFQCKKQQKANRGNVAMSKGSSTQYLQLCYKAAQRLDEKWGKKIWQWSDCSPSTSNATISNPSMGCAGTRHTSSRSSSQWRASLKAKGKGPVVLQETKSHTPGLQPPEPFFTEQGQEDQSSHSPCLICSRRTQSQRRRSASCFLSNYLPTALEKQPRSAKNLQSPKF